MKRICSNCGCEYNSEDYKNGIHPCHSGLDGMELIDEDETNLGYAQ